MLVIWHICCIIVNNKVINANDGREDEVKCQEERRRREQRIAGYNASGCLSDLTIILQ